MAIFVPFGGLLSFHADADDADSQIQFAVGKSTTPQITLTWETLYEKVEGSIFPEDLRLLSPAPIKDPKISYSYLLLADPALAGPAAAVDVERQYNVLLAALTTDYTAGANGPFSGNVGWLRVYGADQQTVWRAWARIEDLPAHLEPGKNVYGYQVPISWTILEGPPPERAQGFVLDA